jgi:hypothetical protein
MTFQVSAGRSVAGAAPLCRLRSQGMDGATTTVRPSVSADSVRMSTRKIRAGMEPFSRLPLVISYPVLPQDTRYG